MHYLLSRSAAHRPTTSIPSPVPILSVTSSTTIPLSQPAHRSCKPPPNWLTSVLRQDRMKACPPNSHRTRLGGWAWVQTGMELPGSRNDILLCAEPQPLVEHCKECGDCLEGVARRERG